MLEAAWLHPEDVQDNCSGSGAIHNLISTGALRHLSELDGPGTAIYGCDLILQSFAYNRGDPDAHGKAVLPGPRITIVCPLVVG